MVDATGVTSRTLRHYDQVGLLHPTRRGPGGLRYYDQRGLVRLQRILLMRPLGLSLTDIAEILNGETSDIDALRTHRDRWGGDAADQSNEWWAELGAQGQVVFRQEVEDLNAAWDQVIASDVARDSVPAQDVAARHVAWLRSAMQGQSI